MTTAQMIGANMGLRSLELVSLFGLAACGSGGSASMQFYLLQGPIAADDPTLVIEAKAKTPKAPQTL